MNKRALLPNLVTLSNLFVGFWAIVKVGEGSYSTACWLIFIAAILDTFDGAVARLVHSSGPFGAQIDSLSDITSFGVAPAYLLYKGVLEPLGFFGVALASLPLLFGALRLARFHEISSEETNGKFTGIPIPVSALLIIGYYLFNNVGREMQSDIRVWLCLVPIVSLLMVSPIPYWKLTKIIPKMVHQTFTGLPYLIICMIGMLWDAALALFPIMLFYVILGPLELGIVHFRRLRNTEDEDQEDEDVSEVSISSRRKFRRKS
jgi:CDP-diacylglycerol---serine O-phosphatidyltransferase